MAEMIVLKPFAEAVIDFLADYVLQLPMSRGPLDKSSLHRVVLILRAIELQMF